MQTTNTNTNTMKNTNTMQHTDAEIRKELLARVDIIKVKITQAGAIHVLTWAPRGDGGPSLWWQYLGETSEFTLPE